MSHQCAPVGLEKGSTPSLILTGFISFSLKQKMIASQQAFFFQANPHIKLANTYKTVSKVHHSVNTSSQGLTFSYDNIIFL